MYGEEATKLLLQLKRTNKWLPPYNDELMRKVIREIKDLYDQLEMKMRETNALPEVPIGDVAAQLVYANTLYRNKRCALAYLHTRLLKLKQLWWETGSVITDDIKTDISSSEQTFFDGYDQLMGAYMTSTGINISEDYEPPKDIWLRVRAVTDHGKIFTSMGVVDLQRNTEHFLRRSDCEMLIRQGVLQHLEESKK